MILPMLFVLAALQEPAQSKPDPVCAADIRWATAGPQTTGRGAADLRTLTLFSAVAQPACTRAEIRLTVAFFDGADELICGGVVSGVATQPDETQLTTLEFHLTNLAEWVRWRSGPHEIAVQTRALTCMNADATGAVAQAAIDRAASIRLYATILTPFRGMATAEMRFSIDPPRRERP